MERVDSSLPLYPIEQWQNSSQSSPASLAPPSPPTTPSSCHIDESYKYIFLPLCYSVTFLLSLVLNSIILHRSFCGGGHRGGGGGRAKRWTPSLTYMVNLATTDLMYGLSLPFLIASYAMRDRWVFGDPVCRLVRFLFYFNLYCSLAFLACISLHRYLGVCHPLRSLASGGPRRAVKGVCLLVWAVVFALTGPIFRFARTGRNRDGNTVCWDDAPDWELRDYVPYGITLHVLLFCLPFGVIGWCYSRVARTIFRSLGEEGGGGGGGGGEEGEVVEAAAAAEEGRGSVKKVGSGKNTNGSNGKGGNKSASSSSTTSSSAPSRPLKVRIKTVKTSSGGITRTVTHVAPRSAAGIPRPPTATAAIPMETEAAGGGGGGREGAVSRKPTPTAEAPKRKPVSLQLGDGARLKGPILPASTIQNASSAMLMAASKAQGRIAALAGATKPEKTKPLAKAAMGRPALSPANQKAVNGAASKPASIVNSGGAVISRSQTSLVEAFNRILNSKNLLPSYQPDLSPPAEWSLELPQCGYRCLECGDAFALERSLARHYDRRSMRIEVTCNHCARRLVFFNKCSLLLHAREHKDTGLVMQCSHLVMRPVSVEQMIGQQPDLTPATGLSKVRNAAAAGGASNGGQGAPGEALTGPPGGKMKEAPQPKPQPQPQPALPLSCRKEELLQYRNFKCPECKKQFKGKTELAAHFQEVISGSDSSCTQCAPVMMMSNPCSGSAHRRMHRHQAPHVCPECGGVARPAGFQTHLKEACLHFSRRIGYKCSSCQVVFGGLNSIKSHIQSVHCEVFHKCPTCPMAFKSSPGAHTHISSQHPSLENQQAKMIYKCVMCDTVFTHKALLHTHFDMHLAKQKVHVFKCPDCTKLYAQKNSMMEHIKSTHLNGGTKPEPPPPAPAQRPSPQKAVRSAGPVKPEPRPSSSSEDEEEGDEEEEEEEGSSPDPPRSLRDGEEGRVPEWRCFECRARFSERDEYVTHMRKDHGKSVKKFPCRLCDRSFCSAPSLRRHVRVNHEGIKRVFHCEYCTEGKRTFSSRLILEKHVRVRHGIRKWGPSSDSEGPARKRRAPLERDSSSDTEGGAAGGGGGGGVRRRRMRVSTPTKIRKRKAPQPQPEPEPAGPFSCQKCGFTTESRPEFQAHIPQHRSDESSHQCTRCGLCFASQPSLNRHCFITHRVKQPSPPGDPSEGEEGPGQQGGLACQVCGKLCETAVDLRTHFRTHGMAFIRATKTGGAEK